MQKITFTTTAGSVSVDDVNVSSVNGTKVLKLYEFDGNSAKNRVNSVQCIGMAGQKVLSSVPEVKTVTAKIGFAPVYAVGNALVCTGSAGMYTLRRELMKMFPLGRTGTLKYTNDSGEWEIQARVDETPLVTVRDGYLCECTLTFTCDYPYWCNTVTSTTKTVNTQTQTAQFIVSNLGDTESPVSGTIYCTSNLGESTDTEFGDYFRLSNGGSSQKAIHFCKPLEAEDELYFSLEYNNELTVKLRQRSGSSSTAWVDAYEYINFPTNYKPCHIGAYAGGNTGTELDFYLLSESGSLSITLDYRFLYTVV